MDFRILGPLEVRHEGDALSLGGPRDRALLVMLVVRAGEVVSTDSLFDALWGDDLPGNPEHALQAAISRLRRTLRVDQDAPELLVRRSMGYVLDIDSDQVDAARFERLVEQGIHLEDATARIASFSEALGMWRGPALADVTYESWAQPDITRLEEMRQRAIEEQITAQLDLGRHSEVLAQLRSLVVEHPLRERLQSLLMVALYRTGRQAEALRVYEDARRVMVDDLGVDPGPELEERYLAVLKQDSSLDWTPPRLPRTNIPQRITTFVGREQEVNRLGELLDQHRLVTAVGPGGAGKTRLVVETGAALLETYPDGVWLVELAPLTDDSQLVHTVAATLHVLEDPLRPLIDAVIEWLRDKELLLILDNCEHITEGSAGFVEAVLSSSDGVSILATSREALRIPGEQVFETPPLSVPPIQVADAHPDHLLGYDAIRLFMDRAAAGQPGFSLSADNARFIAEICVRLAGLPLALELAAALVRSLGVEAIASRLGGRFELLAGSRRTGLPKERSFKAAIDWSYDLSSEQERRVFERISVFAGGFDLEGVEAIATGSEVDVHKIPIILARLVDRSLVQRIQSATGQGRYRLLEPLRQYAQQSLAARGEADAYRLRHLHYFSTWAEAAEPALRGPLQRMWLDRFEIEAENLALALTTARELGVPEVGIRLAASLGPYWQMRGRFTEGRERLRIAISMQQRPSPSAARALVEAAYLTFYQCDYAEALKLAEEALELYQHANNNWGVAYALGKTGLAAWQLGKAERAKSDFTESLRLFRDLDDQWGMATALDHLGIMAIEDGALDEAEAAYEESLTWFQKQGNEVGVGQILGRLADVATLRGDLDRGESLAYQSLRLTQEVGDLRGTSQSLAYLARIAVLRGQERDATDLYRRALRGFSELGDRDTSAECLEGLAGLSAGDGRFEHAATLLGAAEGLRQFGTAFSLPSSDPTGYQRQIETLSLQLGDESFRNAWSQGRMMTLAQACELGLDENR